MSRERSYLDNPQPALTRDGLLHQLFEATARTRPLATAIIADDVSQSYEELDRAANRIARHLIRAYHVGRGDRVAVLLPKSCELYAALIGVLKAGASYVPLDFAYPADRVRFIIENSQAKVLITTGTSRELVAKSPVRLLCLDEERAAVAAEEDSAVHVEHLDGSDEAYVIYTSGTTGRPKGVIVEHGSASHLVRAEQTIYQVRPEDRVLQGFAIAFDASIEEIWVTFHAGATLVSGTPEVMRQGPELPAVLARFGVTVLSVVPSFLALFDGTVDTVRLLILGGEACIPRLLEPWFAPERTIYNTYGPTETTVVATIAACRPGVSVTIGRPLPNYTACLCDEQGELVPPGSSGELVIGGYGVARGYLGNAALTAEKFIANRHAAVTGDPSRVLYRTGDLARLTVEGDLEYLGRIDSQVKIRGYRVELAEIEAVLLELPGVRQAAVAARGSEDDVSLAGFVVFSGEASFEPTAALGALRKRLPPYMVPASLEPIATLPRLPSGKLDRSRLPAPAERPVAPQRRALSSSLFDLIQRSWAELFHHPGVTEDDDFFTDLGGHSLLAARFVSQLRKDPRFAALSVRDLYDHSTIRKLCAHLEALRPSLPPPPATFAAVPRLRYAWSVVLQALMLYVGIGFLSLQWISPFLVYSYMHAYEYPTWQSLTGAFLALALVYPAMLIIAVLVKWLLLGRVRPGDHPLWGGYYLRWLFVQQFLAGIPTHFLSGTPIIRLYLRLLGARVGREVYIDSDLVAGLDTLTIGDGAIINADASVCCHGFEDGLLKIRAVHIGNDATIGTRAVVPLGATIGEGAILDDLSCIAPGATLGPFERWYGSPAVRDEQPAARHERSRPLVLRDGLALLFYGAAFFLLPMLGLLPVLPGVMLMYRFDYRTESYYYLALSPVVAALFVVLSAVQIVLVKWLIVGRLREGVYPIKSLAYVRKWVFDKFMQMSLEHMGTLYATLYLHPWYRALGVRLGRLAEVSTASFILPDLLSICEGSFIADGVGLGAAKVVGDNLVLRRTTIGARSFIGNSALIPVGSTVGDNCLIGCLSSPPAETTANGTSWVGTPAMFLPRREGGAAFDAGTTYAPSRRLYYARLFIELFRVLLPSTAFVLFTTLLLSFFIVIEDAVPMWRAILMFPLIYLSLGVVAALVTALFKWILVGRYRAGEHPLWSIFVWRTELMTGFVESFLNPFFTSHLQGTAFLPWYFRLMGMKVGRRACLHTMDFTEFDLVSLGDDVTLNEDCTIQTHLFEDRVMKLGPIHIGSRVAIGSYTLVLYGTNIEDDVKVGDLSLVMKGETLPAGSQWTGSPVELAGGPDSRVAGTAVSEGGGELNAAAVEGGR